MSLAEITAGRCPLEMVLGLLEGWKSETALDNLLGMVRYLLICALLTLSLATEALAESRAQYIAALLPILSESWSPSVKETDEYKAARAKFGSNKRLEGKLRSILSAKGMDALRESVITKDLYISTEDSPIPQGLFTVKKDQDALVLSRVVVVSQLPQQGFVFVDRIGKRYFAVVSDFGVDKHVGMSDEDIKAFPNDLENVAWPKAMQEVAHVSAQGLTGSLIWRHCGASYKDTLSQGYISALGPIFAKYTALNPERQSAGFAAREFFRIAVASPVIKQCPYFVLPIVAYGLSPLDYRDGDFALSAVRLAFLGQIASTCASKQGTLRLRSLASCSWELLATSDKESFLQVLERGTVKWCVKTIRRLPSPEFS